MPSEGENQLAQLYRDIQALLNRVAYEDNEELRLHTIGAIHRLQVEIYKQDRNIGSLVRFWKRNEYLQQIVGMNDKRLLQLTRMYERLSEVARSAAQQTQQTTSLHQSVQRPILPRAEIAERMELPPPPAGHLAVPRLTTTISNISIRDNYGAHAGYPSQQPSNLRSRSEYNVRQSRLSEQYEEHRREPSEPSVLQPLSPSNARRTTPNDSNRGNTQMRRSALDGPLPRDPHALHDNPRSIVGGHRRQDTMYSLAFGYPAPPSEQSNHSNAVFHATESGFGNQPINRSIDHHGVARPESFDSYPASGGRVSSTGSYGSSGPRRTSEGSSTRGFSTSSSSNGGGPHVFQEGWGGHPDIEDFYATSEEAHGSHGSHSGRNRTSPYQYPQGGPGGQFPQQ